jgi:putative transposase
MNPEDLRFYNPFGEVEKSLNKLPHWEQVGATYFITFRLADAVPLALRTKWKRERDIWLKFHPRPWNAGTEKEYHLRFSAQMDKWLDAGHGSCVLRQVECRAVAERVLRKFDRYIHHAWIIMPNHVHTLTTLKPESPIKDVLQGWKGVSSNGVNRLLGRRGTLWLEDYFDRLIRDGDHFASCVRYNRNNPRKAKLKEGEYTHFETPLAALFADRR